MWLIAGSEISILKRCPADYNRHATIGFTLLMTCLFASVAGGYAGHFFSKSTVASLVVALIWGLLVYSIDRSMVVSLKKDPENNSVLKYFPQLLIRAGLGFLIAFFISIPLELLIFEESIVSQIQIDIVKELDDFGAKATESFGVKKYKEDEQRQSAIVKQIQDALNNPPLTEEYRNLKQVVDECRFKEREIGQQLGRVKVQKDELYRTTPSLIRYNKESVPYNAGKNKQSSQWRNYLAKKKEENIVKSDLRAQQTNCTRAETELITSVKEWRTQQNRSLNKSQKEAQDAKERSGKAVSKTDSTQNKYERIVRNQNGFVRRFVALGNAAKKDYDLFLLLWLVRAIFILIEILPTIVKIYTPVGQYDWAIYQAEKDFREITLRKKTDQLQTDAEQEQNELARQQIFRLQKEGQVHDEIVNKLGEVQTNIAKQVLAEYERQQINQAPQSINSFLSNGSPIV